MKMHRDVQKMDMDALDELIAKCEDSMVRPFSKKKQAVAIEIDPEGGEEGGEEDGDAGDGKPDLSDMDLRDLLELYQEQKGRE